MNKQKNVIAFLLVLGLLLFAMELIFGPANLSAMEVWNVLMAKEGLHPSWETIVWDSRLPRALTAIFAGSGLALSGLLMQTYFRNPLAGPSVLGVSSGASIGVALFVLLSGGMSCMWDGMGKSLALALSAALGAFAVLFIVLAVARKMGVGTLLIFGLMLGYITSSAIVVMQRAASQEALQSFVFWGMGTFSNTVGFGLRILSTSVIVGTLGVIFFVKHLNAMLLGQDYAQSMGVPVRRVGLFMLVVAGILTATITAFCGPIAFLGLAVPHLARSFFKTNNHTILLPAVMLLGVVMGLGCDLLTRVSFGSGLPLNAVTSLLGAPVVIWVILKNRSVFL